ncbi:MAG: GerMN domain-containing protein [Acidimicrobiales bacterium]
MTGRTRILRSVLVIAALVAGCGIEAEDDPRALRVGIDEDRLSIDDRRPGTAVEIATSIYLVTESGRLRPTVRRIGVSQQPSTRLSSVLDELIDGPVAREAQDGLRSAVPATTDVLAVTVDGATAVVDLSSEFASIGGEQELLAVGQMVLTVTTFPGVRRVLLRLDGRPTDLPLPDGSFVDGPVVLRDYAGLLDTDPG